jgi:CheY-like chemotaxis protein
LVVEDQPAVASALREALEDEGYQVAIAEDGRAAFEAMRRDGTPDLVLLDLFMPEMDGWTLTTRMRSDPELARTPIVIMTAGGTSTLAAAPVSDGYMTKPIALDLLFDIVRRITNMHEGTPRTRAAGDGARSRPLAPALPEDEPTLH